MPLLSTSRPVRRAGAATAVAAVLLALAVPAAGAPVPADAAGRPLAGPDSATFPGSQVPLGDRDERGPALPPTSSALAAVASWGEDVRVSWNQYGTPRTLTRPGGWLATGLSGSPEQVARTFLAQRSSLLGLSAEQVESLELVHAAPLAGSDAHAVLLQQSVSGVPLAEDGQVVLGVSGGRVASLTGSVVPAEVLGSLNASAPRLSAARAVLTALQDAGVRGLDLDDLVAASRLDAAGFTLLRAGDLPQHQRARLRALPTTDRGVRLVFETAVQDVAGGLATAAATYVDAVDGGVLLRRDAVDTAAAGSGALAGMRAVSLPGAAALPTGQVAPPGGGTVAGEYATAACSAPVPLAVPLGTRTIGLVVAAAVPSNDIVLAVDRTKDGTTTQIGSIDTLSSPEAGVVSLPSAAAAGETFQLRVCPFEPGTSVAPFTFTGTYGTTDQALTLPPLPGDLIPAGGLQGPPTFRAFGSNPTLPTSGVASPDDRQRVCYGDPDQTTSKVLTGCTFTRSDASPRPYDVEVTTGLPTFSTVGNNAVTTNAQASNSLTPGPPAVPASSPTREYAPPFTDSWHTSSCDPTETLLGADVDAAVVNLFTGHNRAHDFTYRLGLTELTGALQVNNFGKGGAEGDPEVGNTQNAAFTNPTFSVTNEVTTPTSGLGLAGRNNANQITLMDGVPGITNQYLFEPVLGFYGPCADGDLDASIFLHEYTHAVSNRLVGGPGTGLSGFQAGSMGESWSDLVALEYLQAFGLAGKRGEDPFSVGAYATGDPVEGIRDYNLRPDRNPLTYGEVGFDSTGPEVHADGEIWNAVQMTLRQSLVEAYRAAFDPDDAALQESCALGLTAWDACPGNRRWVTYLFDAMLLQASGSPDMLDMRDVTRAATVLRGGADVTAVDEAFASRGMGEDASTVDTDDEQPVPGFSSRSGRNGQVTFALVDAVTGTAVPGEVYVGTYQARSRPLAATTGADGAPDATASLVAGQYQLLVRAAGYGLQRSTLDVTAGSQTTSTLRLLPNVASSAAGAAVRGEEGAVRLDDLVDDDEGTNGGYDGGETTPVAGRTITIDLAGQFQRVERVAVSALGRPVDEEVEGDFQGRLLGLRAFDVQASADGGQTFTTVYSSPDDFFPADRPRTLAPDVQLRTVQLPQPVVADTLRLVVRSNQCTGAPDFNGQQKSALAEAVNGASACAFNLDDTTEPSGQDAGRQPTGGAETFRVLVSEVQAFGTPAAAPVQVAPPAAAGPSRGADPVAAAPRGRSLPATGGVPLAALGGLLLLGAGAAVQRHRRG